MIDRLRWLHISDFHFVDEGDEFSQQQAVGALLDDAVARATETGPFDFILVTGDVAFSGQAGQYDRARDFLLRLSGALAVPPARFFFVPGNHDVDRAKSALAFEGACARLTSQSAVDTLLANRDEMASLLVRQAAFWTFVADFTNGQARQTTADQLGYVSLVQLDQIKVCIMGLNSAWLSGRNAEEMKLVIGERQVIGTQELAQEARPHLRIAIAHHPISWLQEWDQGSCTSRLLATTDIFHRGHLHQAEVGLSASPEHPCLAVAAGSGHATRFYENAYNAIELDLREGRCAVAPYRFDPTTVSFIPGHVVHWDFTLTGFPLAGTSELGSTFAVSVPPVEWCAGYLAALLTGEQAEIPVVLGDGTGHFVAPGAAEEFLSPEVALKVRKFLGLRNLLRLYDEEVSLRVRLEDHQDVISDFADHLAAAASASAFVRDQLAARHETGLRMAEARASSRPNALAFLEDLRAAGDWPLLETQARRFLNADDDALRRTAQRCLVEALMHSDEAPRRAEAALIADQLVARADAGVEDYLRASAAAEVVGKLDRAVLLARSAVTTWPGDVQAAKFGRALATRAGDDELARAVANASKGDLSE